MMRCDVVANLLVNQYYAYATAPQTAENELYSTYSLPFAAQIYNSTLRNTIIMATKTRGKYRQASFLCGSVFNFTNKVVALLATSFG